MISVVLRRKIQCGYVSMLHSLGTAFVSCNTRLRHQQHRSEFEGGTFVSWSAIIYTYAIQADIGRHSGLETTALFTSPMRWHQEKPLNPILSTNTAFVSCNTRLRHQQYRSERDGGTFMSWSAIMYSLLYTSRHRASQRLGNHPDSACNCTKKVMYKCPWFTSPSRSG